MCQYLVSVSQTVFADNYCKLLLHFDIKYRLNNNKINQQKNTSILKRYQLPSTVHRSGKN